MTTPAAAPETARLDIDSARGANATKTTIAGAATLFYGGYTLSDIAMAIGAIVGIIGLLVQTISHAHASVVREREDRRREELHKIRIQLMLDEAHAHAHAREEEKP